MTRRDAHYLHERKALEPLLAVPGDAPRCASWAPDREMLLLADARGLVQAVEPSFGSRRLFDGPADPVHVSSHGNRIAVLSATGRVEVREGSGEPVLVLETGLTGEAGLRFWRGGLAVVGEGPTGRMVRVYEGATETRSVPVLPGTALGVSEEGELLQARSVPREMRVGPLGSPLPVGAPTGHLLRFSHAGRVLGVAEGGATLWHEGRPLSARLLDAVAAALCSDGRTLALGTAGGVVALVDILAPASSRAHPPRVAAHAQALRAMAFSSRGRWLATIAENCRLWAY